MKPGLSGVCAMAMRHAQHAQATDLPAETRRQHRREVVAWARYVVRCLELDAGGAR